jgi:hypothetical protein
MRGETLGTNRDWPSVSRSSVQLVLGVSSPEVNRQGRGVAQPTPFGAGVKEYSYISTSLTDLHTLFYDELYLLSLLTLLQSVKSFNR